MITKATPTEMLTFLNYLNSRTEHVNFTMECDPVSIRFLDVSVYICDGKLHTDLYRKPTDRNTILRGDSFHPRPLIKSLPISQFKRVRRVCSTAESYSQQSTDLTKRFLNRGYRKEWIDNAKKKVNETSQIQCLRTKHNNKTQFSNAPICTIKYSALGAEFRRVLNKHWHIISSDPKLSGVFKNDPKLVFKRQNNLRDLLVKSEFPSRKKQGIPTLPSGNYRCGNCVQCAFTHKCNSFSHPRTGRNISIRGTITCASTHVIYLIRCPCGLAYVGKTSRQLRTRISEHRSNIRTGDMRSPIASHFRQVGHNVSVLQYIGIEKVIKPSRGGDYEKKLLQRECFWIYTLNTLSPSGLNEDFDIKPFL